MQKLDDVREQLFTDLDALSELAVALEKGVVPEAVELLSKFKTAEGEVLARSLIGSLQESAYYEGGQ